MTRIVMILRYRPSLAEDLHAISLQIPIRRSNSGTFLIHAPETGMTVFTFANGDHLRVSPATGAVAEAIGDPATKLDPAE